MRPGVEFPAAFGLQGQLIGMAAAKDIPPLTAFLYVPQEMQINKFTIRKRNPDLMAIFTTHEKELDEHYDPEYLSLIIYVFSELLKGEDSFWKPYFDVINETD